MPLLLRKRVAFIHIPKTGGTTLEQVLMEGFPEDFCFIDTRGFGPLRYNLESLAARVMTDRVRAVNCENKSTFQHWTFEEIKGIIPDLDTWWTFAFVRSPWARLFSEYRYQSRFLNRCDTAFEEWVPRILNKAKEHPSILDNHLRPQWEFLGSNTEVFRFEQFGVNVNQIIRRLGLPPRRLSQHYRSGAPEEFRSAYSDKLAALVHDFYREDTIRFGYSFDQTTA